MNMKLLIITHLLCFLSIQGMQLAKWGFATACTGMGLYATYKYPLDYAHKSYLSATNKIDLSSVPRAPSNVAAFVFRELEKAKVPGWALYQIKQDSVQGYNLVGKNIIIPTLDPSMVKLDKDLAEKLKDDKHFSELECRIIIERHGVATKSNLKRAQFEIRHLAAHIKHNDFIRNSIAGCLAPTILIGLTVLCKRTPFVPRINNFYVRNGLKIPGGTLKGVIAYKVIIPAFSRITEFQADDAIQADVQMLKLIIKELELCGKSYNKERQQNPLLPIIDHMPSPQSRRTRLEKRLHKQELSL